MWWMAIVGACMGIQDQYISNRVNKANYKAAAKTAEINARLAKLNNERRTIYHNEEMGQQTWNIRKQAEELIANQKTAMAASGFDVSSGDKRILADTYRRATEETSGINRSYQLQQLEDDLQTYNDVLQYNFEAYANRKMAKQYSGINGLAKIIDAGGRGALGGFSMGTNFGGGSGKVSSNTGASGNWMSQGTNMAKSAGPSGFGSNKLSLGSFSNFSSSFNNVK